MSNDREREMEEKSQINMMTEMKGKYRNGKRSEAIDSKK